MIVTLQNEYDVAKSLNLTIKELDELLINLNYNVFYLPKKKGGKRKITAPSEQLKLVQQKINVLLNRVYEEFNIEYVFGFSKKRNTDHFNSPIVSNASFHVQKNYILSLDIHDFFESITAKQIFDLFSSKPFNFSEKVALIFTRLTTYKGILPTGAPTSPLLSNFIFYQIDCKIQSLMQENQITYTRYADDITLSSNFAIDLNMLGDLELIISPFKLNTKKTRLINLNSQQKVTGIVVNQKLNIDRKWLKKTRAMFHDLSINGLSIAAEKHFKVKGKESSFLNKLIGNISFIFQVRGKEDRSIQLYLNILKSQNLERK